LEACKVQYRLYQQTARNVDTASTWPELIAALTPEQMK
jgi:hypothetical protein